MGRRGQGTHEAQKQIMTRTGNKSTQTWATTRATRDNMKLHRPLYQQETVNANSTRDGEHEDSNQN